MGVPVSGVLSNQALTVNFDLGNSVTPQVVFRLVIDVYSFMQGPVLFYSQKCFRSLFANRNRVSFSSYVCANSKLHCNEIFTRNSMRILSGFFIGEEIKFVRVSKCSQELATHQMHE